jgi:hypothetical protein
MPMRLTDSRQRLFMIHAGTHKTASSYIQSRIAANRHELREANVQVSYPASPNRKHKPLAAALAARKWDAWHRYLKSLPQDGEVVLVSAEQFTQLLVKPKLQRSLLEMLEAEGFRLAVMFFLRDQPDYINARFVHSTRRLYHHLPFDDYVRIQLNERDHIYDYFKLFSPLVGNHAIQATFLPYGSSLGDPFERLVSVLGIQTPAGGWRSADPTKSNIQPGCQGVWLAQRLSERLEQLGISGPALVNTGAIVRHIVVTEGLEDDRYWGFDESSAAVVSEHYSAHNNQFAQKVWGCDWRDKIPELMVGRCEFQPPLEPAARSQLDALVEKGLYELARENPSVRRALCQQGSSTMASVSRG